MDVKRLEHVDLVAVIRHGLRDHAYARAQQPVHQTRAVAVDQRVDVAVDLQPRAALSGVRVGDQATRELDEQLGPRLFVHRDRRDILGGDHRRAHLEVGRRILLFHAHQLFAAHELDALPRLAVAGVDLARDRKPQRRLLARAAVGHEQRVAVVVVQRGEATQQVRAVEVGRAGAHVDVEVAQVRGGLASQRAIERADVDLLVVVHRERHVVGRIRLGLERRERGGKLPLQHRGHVDRRGQGEPEGQQHG